MWWSKDHHHVTYISIKSESTGQENMIHPNLTYLAYMFMAIALLLIVLSIVLVVTQVRRNRVKSARKKIQIQEGKETAGKIP